MTTIATTHRYFHDDERERFVSHRITRYLVPVGRVLFALIFLTAAPMHFTGKGIGYAVAMGVPAAKLLVPASGILALLGALSVAFGYRARLGAFLLVLFLIPVTLMMHRFWAAPDAQQAMVQQVMFLKNLAMLGAALFLTHIGAGPLSIDAQIYHAQSREIRESSGK